MRDGREEEEGDDENERDVDEREDRETKPFEIVPGRRRKRSSDLGFSFDLALSTVALHSGVSLFHVVSLSYFYMIAVERWISLKIERPTEVHTVSGEDGPHQTVSLYIYIYKGQT